VEEIEGRNRLSSCESAIAALAKMLKPRLNPNITKAERVFIIILKLF
jgi:hypothetical protein